MPASSRHLDRISRWLWIFLTRHNLPVLKAANLHCPWLLLCMFCFLSSNSNTMYRSPPFVPASETTPYSLLSVGSSPSASNPPPLHLKVLPSPSFSFPEDFKPFHRGFPHHYSCCQPQRHGNTTRRVTLISSLLQPTHFRTCFLLLSYPSATLRLVSRLHHYWHLTTSQTGLSTTAMPCSHGSTHCYSCLLTAPFGTWSFLAFWGIFLTW